MYLPKYRLRKTWLDKCLKRRVSEDPWTENMENWSKQFSNTVKVVALEKVSFGYTQNPQTVC